VGPAAFLQASYFNTLIAAVILMKSRMTISIMPRSPQGMIGSRRKWPRVAATGHWDRAVKKRKARNRKELSDVFTAAIA
jgi:hypothetical protein